MTKNEQTRAICLLIVVLIPFFTSTCVNGIQDETTELSSSDTPIKISTNISCTQSRINNDQFEMDDAIGFYALTESQSLNGTRYIDNMRFICTSTGFLPDEEVFYPSGNNKCDFISYYPYQKKAIAADESSIKVTIKNDQSQPAEYSTSDFMTAALTGVSSSNKSVKLDFRHKLSQLNIVLQLTENDYIQEIKDAATVSISNACTEASFDFNTDTFTPINTSQEIIPNGEWTVDEETQKLTGKKVLLVPQQMPEYEITLCINGRTLSSPLPEDLIIESNKSSEIILHYDTKVGISKLETNICTWKEGNSKNVTLEEEETSNFIRISELDFGQTGVHQITTKSDAVIGQVCKEYLLGNNIDAQAIVLYPATTNNQGIVLQLLGESENIHGGSLTWNANTNSFTYTPGSDAPIADLYADTEENILFKKPANPQRVTAIECLLTDIRETETVSYPIVKIGTQYWMGENLNTKKYNDGKSISKITDMKKTAAGYYIHDDLLFYNQAAVLKGTLAPQGWKIPTNADWAKLKDYVRNSSSVLKGGTQWVSLGGVKKANNKTGFNAEPIGVFNRTEAGGTFSSGFGSDYVGKYAIYWNMENSQTSLFSSSLGLTAQNDELGMAKYNEYSGFSIRCVRE